MLRLLIGQWTYARPIALPGGVPGDRVAAWRVAFDVFDVDSDPFG